MEYWVDASSGRKMVCYMGQRLPQEQSVHDREVARVARHEQLI
jgi:hypothetical protein